MLGGNAETLEKYANQRLASKSYKIIEIYVKSFILEGVLGGQAEARKLSEDSDWQQQQQQAAAASSSSMHQQKHAAAVGSSRQADRQQQAAADRQTGRQRIRADRNR